MSENKKERSYNSAKLLFGKFISSNLSTTEEYSWLTGNAIAILFYICNVIDINWAKNGKAICDKSYQQIAKFSHTSLRSINRYMPYFIKYGFLSILSKEQRKTCVYELGHLLKSQTQTGAMVAPDYPQVSDSNANWCHGGTQTGATMAPVLGENWCHGGTVVIRRACKNICKKEHSALSVDNLQKTKAGTLISNDFEMSHENKVRCIERGIDPLFMHGKFLKFFRTKDYMSYDWHAEEARWIKREHVNPLRIFKKETPFASVENQSTSFKSKH